MHFFQAFGLEIRLKESEDLFFFVIFALHLILGENRDKI